MRTPGLLALRLRAVSLSLLASVVAAGAAACEDSSGAGGGGTFELDAGAFEASAPIDAAPVDGGQPDTSLPPEAGPALGVGVTVLGNGGPRADVRVVFHDATGAVLGETKTDAAGKARTATAPSMVTVLYRPSGYAQAITFMGVVDGDALVVTPEEEVTVTQLGTYAVTFTAGAGTTGADFFDVKVNDGSCSNFGTTTAGTVNVPILDRCARATNTVFVTAQSPSTTVGYGIAKNVANPAGGATLAVPAIGFTAAGTRTLKATNLPAGDVSREADIRAVIGPDNFFLASTSGAIDTAAGVTAKAPSGIADAYQVMVGTSQYANGAESATRIMRRDGATADVDATFAVVDFATALPGITAATVSTAGAGGSARPDVALTVAGTPSALGLVGRFEWYGEGNAGNWTFVMPGTTKTWKAPALPADAGAFLPHDAIVVSFAGYVDGAALGSFAALKKLPVVPEAYFPDVLEPYATLPVPGVLKVSTFRSVND